MTEKKHDLAYDEEPQDSPDRYAAHNAQYEAARRQALPSDNPHYGTYRRTLEGINTTEEQSASENNYRRAPAYMPRGHQQIGYDDEPETQAPVLPQTYAPDEAAEEPEEAQEKEPEYDFDSPDEDYAEQRQHSRGTRRSKQRVFTPPLIFAMILLACAVAFFLVTVLPGKQLFRQKQDTTLPFNDVFATASPTEYWQSPSETPLPTMTPEQNVPGIPAAAVPAAASLSPAAAATLRPYDGKLLTPVRLGTPYDVSEYVVPTQAPKYIALTFDDGPSKYTSRILKVLEENDARATFFVLGDRLNDYSDTLKAEYDLGCQIGNHTYGHKTLTKLSKKEIRSELSKTDALIEKYTGEHAIIMRPPGGSTNDTVKATVDLPIIKWSIDTRDWETRDRDKTVAAVLDNVEEGDIILMHDLYESTADAVEILVPKLIERGFTPVTVSELFRLEGKKLKDGTAYLSAK